MNDAQRRVLFIENSVGLGGSTVSLATLLPELDARYRPAVALSRPEQERFLRDRINPLPPVAVIRCRPTLKQSALFSPIVARAERLFGRRGGVVGPAVSALDVPVVLGPYVWRLRRFARRVGVDVIQHNNGFDFAALLLKTVLGVPLLAYQRGWEWDSYTIRRFGNRVDRYVANSETMREHLIDLGIEPGRIDVVYPPIDLARFHPGVDCTVQRRELGDAPCFGVIGAITEYRGHRTFVHAAARVLAQEPQSRAFVIGASPAGEEAYREELVRLAHELGVADRITFTGYRGDVPALMQMLDVVVHTADFSEPFGRAIAEAMALGKTVIATHGGGPRELICDGDTGYLVAPNDPEALASRIVECLRDRNLTRRLGERAHDEASRRFGAHTHAIRMQAIYDRLIGVSPPQAAAERSDASIAIHQNDNTPPPQAARPS